MPGNKLMRKLGVLVESASKIKLRGGMVGKLCVVLMFACVSMAAIAWSVANSWVAALCAVLMFGMVTVLGWRMLNLADKNPYSALFEGGELLEHEQLKFGAKGRPNILTSLGDETADPDSPAGLLTLADDDLDDAPSPPEGD